MAQSILSKIKKPQSDMGLKSVLELTEQQLMAQARTQLQPELDRARSQATTAQSRAEAAELECRTAKQQLKEAESRLAEAESLNKQMKQKCERLEKQILLEQDTAKKIRDEGVLRADSLLNQISNGERELREMATKMASLEGKLSVKPKTVTETKVIEKQGKPREIPEFVVENIIRGPNDKIVSASIKPR